MPIVKIHFEDEQQAKNFVSWLCESGEQMYFQHLEDSGDNGVEQFHYHIPQATEFPFNDVKRYTNSKFGGEDGLQIIAGKYREL
mgnify:CR=1 FL=1